MDIDSTNLLKADYDQQTKTLEVWFRDGSQYKYAMVPEAVWKAFSDSASKGEYFAARIRGRYKTQRVR